MPKRDQRPEPRSLFASWTRGFTSVLERLPGAALVQQGVAAIERQLLSELKTRLDALDSAKPAAVKRGAPDARPPPDTPEAPESPAAILTALLERSLEQSFDDSRQCTFLAILRQLVPDEARILAALSSGEHHPLIHLGAGPPFAPPTRRVVSNVSSVGQAAGVQWRQMTPHYVTHLRELGLVEVGPQDDTLALKYEILETDSRLREAIEHIEKTETLIKPRLLRRTLRITALGRELWEACNKSEEGEER